MKVAFYERTGPASEVLVVSADVSDEQQMRAAIATAQQRFGAIHGVIHAAGVPGGGIIQLKTAAMAVYLSYSRRARW